MTKSSSQVDRSTSTSSQPSKSNGFRNALVLIFRLLLLGVGGSLALIAGVIAAQLRPATVSEPPLLQRSIEAVQRFTNQAEELPQTWYDGSSSPAPASPNAASPDAASSPAASPIAAPVTRAAQADQLLMTLPSDALFTADQTLQPNATALLDSIVADLQRYPGATIRVMGHSDRQGEADRSRTFEQAQAVKQYLASKLGDQVHWVAAGYGHSRPLTTGESNSDRQRNRRIEIGIEPQ